MPKADFFQRLGLYSIERFLDADLCGRLQTAFRTGARHAATVGVRRTADFVVDPAIRSVRWVELGASLESEVRAG